jgi:pyruvate kinase
MDYEIIATIGPASRTPDVIAGMMAAGATALRINTSHLSVEELGDWIHSIETNATANLPIVLDLQGSKWRLGELGTMVLTRDAQVVLVHAQVSSQPDELPVPHADFFQAAGISDGRLLLNDAKVILEVETMESHRLEAVVARGGEISAFKGITFSRTEFRTESLRKKDAEILARTRELPQVRYALSYVKDVVEMQNYRSSFGSDAYLIAKLERPEALQESEEIARIADELWLCRGDLGAELGLRDMARESHELSKLAASFSVPVMLAGQVLEHMANHETPTRAEVCSLYDALKAGYNGIVLSDETAIGRFPIESCRVAALFR